MTNENENVTPSEPNTDQQEQLDFGAMIRNASPTLRRFVVYQGVVLVVLIMLVVGTVAYRASVQMLAPDEEEASGGPAVRAENAGAIALDIAGVQGQEAVGLNVRPEGSILIRAERQESAAGPILVLHFRHQGKDYIRIVDETTGAVTAYDIP